ncbi:MAG: 2Fe-2S iron-sulfur cluster binding domain-containing protein, partial [Actinobacteria bacterium]|nr:2Fe-2S iron-sulfur cluster binding domain-containing protein [Actinomycetota bacterium]
VNYQVAVTFEGDTGFPIECREDEDVVTAALRQGYILLTECRDGVCATCKCLLVDGDYDDLLPHSIHALSPSEEEDGWVLACRLQPRSDLVLDYDYPVDRVERFAEGRRQGQIIALDRLCDTVVRVVVRTLAAQDPVAFEPGQYVRLTLPGIGVSRDYSMANVAAGERELEFLIRVLPDGAFSGYVAGQGRIGEVVEVEGPFGRFCLRPGAPPPVFVAGGTGVAPIMSMLRSLAAERPDDPAVLFFGNTAGSDVFFERELAELAKEFPSLVVHHCVVNPPANWDGEIGLVTDVMSARLEDPASHAYYLCGPPPMIEATRNLLADKGVPKEQVFEENFLPSGNQEN